MKDEVIWLRGQGHMASMNHLTKCTECGRKIMVSLAMIGVPHHAGLAVMCAECIKISDEHRQQFPEETRKLEEWINQ